jgi:molybdopterin-guanine dinucleotide biosynthesis protein A
MNYDATIVILAGGRNARLAGVVPDYHKPFIVHGGRSLLANQVTLAGELGLACVVVCAPENALGVTSLLRRRWALQPELHLVVQPEARGPAEGLHRALSLVETRRVIVLCVDNTLTLADLRSCVESASVLEREHVVVGGRWLPPPDARRFARVSPDRKFIREGSEVTEPLWPGDMCWCWVGPLVLPTHALRQLLGAVPTPPRDDELKLGSLVAGLNFPKRLVEVSSWDVGVPGELP